MPKDCKNVTKFNIVQFSTEFGLFLCPGGSDQVFVFCIVSQDTSLEFPQRVIGAGWDNIFPFLARFFFTTKTSPEIA